MTRGVQSQPPVLLLECRGTDAAFTRKVLSDSEITVQRFATMAELTTAIGDEAGAAILAEESLEQQSIDDLARKLAVQPRWSSLPIIVLTGSGMSTAATEQAVRSRAPLGSLILLERPFRPVTLSSAVRTGLAARTRQYEIRDHLREREAAEQVLLRVQNVLESTMEERTEALRKLSSRLMHVQDEERRRIARELHDSLGQYLAAAKINLEVLSAGKNNGNGHLHEAQHLIDRAISDIRTLSHLLHPPLLEEAGFGSAARWFVEGFGRRSGIAARLRMPAKLDRLPSELETTLFRILQEALTNVHRHSGSRDVEVRLTVYRSVVTLAIDDNGKGIPRDVLERFGKSGVNLGVGLAGMRERVKELGGRLEIESDKSGTRLRAIIPIPTEQQGKSPSGMYPAFPNSSAV